MNGQVLIKIYILWNINLKFFKRKPDRFMEILPPGPHINYLLKEKSVLKNVF